MKKTLAVSFLFVFVMALGTPVMANTLPQEPVKTEKKAEKKKGECSEETKKKCCDQKKSECGGEKKEEKKG